LLPDGRVLLVGGNGEDETGKGTLASAELFDPATGTFSDTGSLTSNRSGHGAVGLADGRVLITGGDNHDGSPRSSEIFDPTMGRFALAALAVGTGQRDALLLPDGRVLVVGGTEPTAIAELFDPHATSSATTGSSPSSGPFRPVTGDLEERFGQTATLLADGRVLMVGGSRYAPGDFWGRPLASAVLYDPFTDSVTETGSLGTPRAFHTATLLPDGRVLVAGGDGPGRATEDPNDLYQPLASAELYDPATGRFSETGAMSVGRGPSYMPMSDHERQIALLLADGRVLMAGGVAAESAPDALPIELYDPTSGSFEALSGECSSGLGMTGVGQALGEGRALVACGDTVVVVDPQDGLLTLGDAGGWQDGWGIAVEDKVVLTAGDTGPVVLVDPATGRIASIDEVTGRGPLSDLLVGPDALVQAAVRLPSGRLVIVGRSYDEPTRGLAAIHDPATGRTTRLQPLAARTWPTVTVLDDGRVLIAGQPIRSPDHLERRPPASELLDPGQVP
jgi:hypothetical protein